MNILPTPDPQSAAHSRNNLDSIRLSRLTNTPVINHYGETLGHIRDFVINSQNNQIVYAVLVNSNFLALNEKFYAIPINILTFIQESEQFLLEIDRKQIDADAGFDKKNWPDCADKKWETHLFMHYCLTGTVSAK